MPLSDGFWSRTAWSLAPMVGGVCRMARRSASGNMTWRFRRSRSSPGGQVTIGRRTSPIILTPGSIEVKGGALSAVVELHHRDTETVGLLREVVLKPDAWEVDAPGRHRVVADRGNSGRPYLPPDPCTPTVPTSLRFFASGEHVRGTLPRQTERGLMYRQRSPVQDPELIDRRRPADAEPLEALDPAAPFMLGQQGMAKRLAQPCQPPRRR